MRRYPVVYLLHFDEGLPRGVTSDGRPVLTRHYMGTTIDLDARLRQHRSGRGARLVAAVVQRGIRVRVGRLWAGGRSLERRLKRHKNHPKLCRICRAPAPIEAEDLDFGENP